MNRLAALVLLLGSCGPDHDRSPVYGIPLEAGENVDVPLPVLLAWADLRAEEWIAHKVDWGCGGFSDEELRRAVRLDLVRVRVGFALSNGLAGWNSYKRHRIDVPIDFPVIYRGGPYDPLYTLGADGFMDSYGLRYLPHEWTHTVRGNWHP